MLERLSSCLPPGTPPDVPEAPSSLRSLALRPLHRETRVQVGLVLHKPDSVGRLHPQLRKPSALTVHTHVEKETVIHREGRKLLEVTYMGWKSEMLSPRPSILPRQGV